MVIPTGIVGEQLEGRRVGRYQIQRLLGNGGSASVYLGYDVAEGTEIAIKVVRFLDSDSAAWQQMVNERYTLTHLTHPHIIGMRDFVVEFPQAFLILEYASGGALSNYWPAGSKLPLEAVVSYVKQIADALSCIHTQGFIHRDIKPENLLLKANKSILLCDFGITLQIGRGVCSSDCLGTATYVAPEQINGQSSIKSDQYALGVVTYELLCGTTPFVGPLRELVVNHLFIKPPALRTYVKNLPIDVEKVVMKALEKNPECRFAGVQEFAQALENAYKSSLNTGFLTPDIGPFYIV